MDRTHINQQTSTTLHLRGQVAHEAPTPHASGRIRFRGALQWVLEGRGAEIVRPVVDLVLLLAAVVVAIGGVNATLNVPASVAPLLALPPLVVMALYLRGLYRIRLRALLLERALPVVSAVSVAAMLVAVLGTVSNGAIPPSPPGCERGSSG